ncbi:Angiotensin-converting enzyme [Papilio xuthus]|uniref:Angiotensin-converting enzyme n=1 Tax=Papilio xuthus TaxID=66420 RepID=A0A194PUR6_PAPXU|nr:Angiotensin-converting enzyme [Papilio xuthus]
MLVDIRRSHDPYEVGMNFLMTMALEKVAYLPFAFMVDQWRWSVFEEGVENLNARWWQMKLRYQGVIPPLKRTEEDFDPGAKYHIISDQVRILFPHVSVTASPQCDALIGG